MTEEKKEELTEEQKQFVVEADALKRSIRKNKSASRFAIFVLFVVWGAVILDAIEAFMLPGGGLTLKHISVQSSLHFHLIWAFIYTLWCSFQLPKNAEDNKSAIEAFLKKWAYLSEKKEDTEDTSRSKPVGMKQEYFDKLEKGLAVKVDLYVNDSKEEQKAYALKYLCDTDDVEKYVDLEFGTDGYGPVCTVTKKRLS